MGDKIKISIEAARVNSGMSRKDWAKAIGSSVYKVKRWETGHAVPNITEMRRISEVSGIPIDCIFFPEESEQFETKGSA